MNIEQNVALRELNTLGVASYAQFMAKVSSIEELAEVAAFAQASNLKLKVLGGGSNVVLPESVSGLIVQFLNCQCDILKEDDTSILIRVGAGFNWHELVMYTLQQGWNGLQNLAYIPGLVGAAPVQNIGAYGVEVKEFIQSVHGVFLESLKKFEFDNAACKFEYRESVFKQALDCKVLITAVDFVLSKAASVNVGYSPLDQMANERGAPSPLELARWVISVRKSKLPQPSELPNAGSFFKNPVISDAAFENLASRYPDAPHYKQEQGVKIPAGWLIDKMGYKGKAFGPVSVHKQQALVLVNNGGSGEEVLAAAHEIKEAVFERYGIKLEQEPRVFV